MLIAIFMISGITLFTNSWIHLFLIFIVMKLLQIEKMEVSKAQTANYTVVGSYTTQLS